MNHTQKQFIQKLNTEWSPAMRGALELSEEEIAAGLIEEWNIRCHQVPEFIKRVNKDYVPISEPSEVMDFIRQQMKEWREFIKEGSRQGVSQDLLENLESRMKAVELEKLQKLCEENPQ